MASTAQHSTQIVQSKNGDGSRSGWVGEFAPCTTIASIIIDIYYNSNAIWPQRTRQPSYAACFSIL